MQSAPGGASLSALKEGKSKNERMSTRRPNRRGPAADSPPDTLPKAPEVRSARRRDRRGAQCEFPLKRLSLLKEMLPQLRRVAMLWNKGDRGMSLRYEASAVAAQELGVIVQPLGVREPDDFNEAFDAMNRERPDAILMVSDSLTLLNRRRVFEYAAERRLPAIYETDSLTREGGLMSYGPDRREIFERSAALVDRIFKGTKPADLPVEQPTRFLFVLNLKTAKAMGLNVPNTLLALADEVVE